MNQIPQIDNEIEELNDSFDFDHDLGSKERPIDITQVKTYLGNLTIQYSCFVHLVCNSLLTMKMYQWRKTSRNSRTDRYHQQFYVKKIQRNYQFVKIK